MEIDFTGILNLRKAEKKTITNLLTEQEKVVVDSEKELADALVAQKIVWEVARQTQEGLSIHIEKVVGLALSTVFPDEYNFKVAWGTKNNKTECSMYFLKNGEKFSPTIDGGHGVADLCAVAIRFATWTLGSPKSAPIFLLDEPTAAVSKEHRNQSSEFFGMMCKELGIQILTATHEDSLIEGADKVFSIKKVDGFSSIIEEVENE